MKFRNDNKNGIGPTTCLIVGILMATAVAPAAFAVPVTYNFTGTAFSASGIFAGEGSAVTGTFSFDDGLLDFIPGGSQDIFQNNIPVANQPLTSAFAASLTVGGVTVSDTSSNQTNFEASLELIDAPTEDRIRYRLIRETAADPFFELVASDLIGGPDGVAPGSGNLTGSIGDARHSRSAISWVWQRIGDHLAATSFGTFR